MDQVLAIPDDNARLNITFSGQNFDLPDPVRYDADPELIRHIATEAVRTGSIPGIPSDPGADFTNFVVEKFEPIEGRPWRMISLRPKVPFGNV